MKGERSLRSGASLHEGEPTPLRRAAGGEGEAAALIRQAAAPWSPASHSLFPVVVLWRLLQYAQWAKSGCNRRAAR